MTIKEIRALTGLTQKQFAEKYHITFSSIRNWEIGRRTCPDYVAELLEFKVREDLKMDKMTFRDILKFMADTTEITLYVNSREIPEGSKIYSLPDRHDLNQFYGCEVEEIKPTGEGKVEIYVKCDDVMLLPFDVPSDYVYNGRNY